MSYTFNIPRKTWKEAAQDAVDAGFAIWVTEAKQAIKWLKPGNIVENE